MFYSFIAIAVVSLLSLIGVFTLLLKRLALSKIISFLVSFAAGGLLGDTFLHLLPEVVEKDGFSLKASSGLLLGILLFFILEKFISWRHCHVPTSSHHPHPVGMMNLVGDGLHNFIDGMVIVSSFLVSTKLGLATSLAVILHEIPQEIGDFGVLLHAGFSRKKALIFNFLSAATAFLGGLIVLRFQNPSDFLIPFTAGGFIYIAGSDLIPELHKETAPRKSLVQLGGLILGIGVMFGLLYLPF